MCLAKIWEEKDSEGILAPGPSSKCGPSPPPPLPSPHLIIKEVSEERGRDSPVDTTWVSQLVSGQMLDLELLTILQITPIQFYRLIIAGRGLEIDQTLLFAC